jgi:hypothetical protein
MAAPSYGSHVNNLETFVWSLPGDRDATALEAISFDAPWAGALVHFEVSARASTGTSETCDVDIQQGTTSLLGSAVAVTAAARTEGTLAAANTFAKDTQISVDLTLGGTSPVFSDVTIVAMFERR